MSSPPGSALAPREAFLALAGATAVAALVVWLIGTDPSATHAALAALIFESALSLGLALAPRRADRVGLGRALAIGALALPTAPVAWLFGPNAGFAAFLTIALATTGVLSGGSPVKGASRVAWLVYAGIALGEAAVFGAVLARRLPDRSLTPVLVGDHPDWHHAISHAFLQGIFLASLLAGRAIGRRYARLVAALEASSRLRAGQEALVAEARAEYQRTLEASQRGLHIAVSRRAPRTGEDTSEVLAAKAPDAATLRARVVAAGPLGGAALRALAEALARDLEALHARGLAHLAVSPNAVIHEADGWR
ncbi:MAG: hypothetical protein R3B82_29745, partial [Sandaracinaceae bacterium]